MKKWIRFTLFTILSFLFGLYLPVIAVAILSGETNYEKVLPYCLLSAILFVAGYIAIEIYITNKV